MFIPTQKSNPAADPPHTNPRKCARRCAWAEEHRATKRLKEACRSGEEESLKIGDLGAPGGLWLGLAGPLTGPLNEALTIPNSLDLHR